MTPTREAIVLPGLFLTVVLLGGLSVTDVLRFVPPGLDALVLAVMLLGSLVRSGVLVPSVFVAAGRTVLENVCGAVVLLTLFAASAQTFNLLTPDQGLLRVFFSVFFFVQLLTTLAAVPSRRAMLRSLMVLFGSAFVLRFIVLESLYAHESSMLQRVLTTALEGVTLGALDYEPHASITGYAAFLALVLYMTALMLLAPVTTALQKYASLPSPGTLSPTRGS